MANDDYEQFCLAEIPGLTLLDRQILGHYCARYNKDKGKAWPSMPELLRITGVQRPSIDRSRSRLVEVGLLIRVTRGQPGQQAEFAINLELIKSYIRVTEQLHITKEQVTVELQEVPEQLLTSTRAVGIEYPSSYSKRIKLIKPKNVSNEVTRFDFIISKLPNHIKSEITYGKNFDRRIDELQRQGTTLEAIRDHLEASDFTSSNNVGGLVIYLLDRLLAGDPLKRKVSSNQPPAFIASEFDHVKTPMPDNFRSLMDNFLPRPDAVLYKVNKKSDHDSDGIACEK